MLSGRAGLAGTAFWCRLSSRCRSDMHTRIGRRRDRGDRATNREPRYLSMVGGQWAGGAHAARCGPVPVGIGQRARMCRVAGSTANADASLYRGCEERRAARQ